MSDYMIISKADLNGIVRRILAEPLPVKPYITQNQAMKLLGRRRYEKALREGQINFHKLDMDKQFSRVMVLRKDVERLINNK